MPDISLTLIILILLSLGATLWQLLKHERTKPLSALLLILSFFSLFHYLNYGDLMNIRDPIDPRKTRHTLVHWHEIFHYYMGAKYYKELGNEGLYAAYVLADTESDHPLMTKSYIRDLSNQTFPITKEEALRRATTIFLPRFQAGRWEEFKRDVEFLKRISFNGWLDVGLFDAGFNPPPAWNVIGYPLANLIPLSKNGGNISPRLAYIELLSLLDVGLLGTAALLIYRSFGLIGMCSFLIMIGTSFISGSGWTAGSFLRHIWLFALTGGICMMKDKRYMAAGIFLTLSSLMRIFPFVFAASAGAWLGWRWLKNRNDRQALEELQNFIMGGLGCAFVLITASLMMFGLDSWIAFFKHISTHSKMFFVWHIGYQKLATWAPWVPNQDFWWEDGLNRFRDWNNRLIASWNSQLWFQIPFITLLLGMATWALRNMRGHEAVLLPGGLAIFLLEVPANYYYIYFALLPVVFFTSATRDDHDWRDDVLLFGSVLLWIIIPLIPRIQGDDLTHAYHVSYAIFVFFLMWLGLRFFHKDSRLAKYLAISLKD